jgi:transcriptional regulator with XRE-family HTH domain
MRELLPHLAAVTREARIAAGLTYAHIAVHVRKRDGRLGVSESTVARFEYGKQWPENPDAMLDAYGAALDVHPVTLWRSAIDKWAATVTATNGGKANRPPRRRRRPSTTSR